jgi:hypothetical protein
LKATLKRTFKSGTLPGNRRYPSGNESFKKLKLKELEEVIGKQDDERLFAIAEYFRKGGTVGDVHKETMIDEWFLEKIVNIIHMETENPKRTFGC